MATVLDLGLLKGFGDLFAWILVFVIVYGALEVTNLLKSKGLHALFAFAITAVIVITGGGTNIITAMAPWFVVLAAFFFFMLVLAAFAGSDMKDLPSFFGKRSVIWIIAIPLLVILIIAWTQGPQQEPSTDGSATETPAPQQQREFIGVLRNPKVLGLVLILGISAIAIALMAGGGGAIK